LVAELPRQGVVDDAHEDILIDVCPRRFLERREAGKLLDAVDPILQNRQPRRIVLGEKDRELREAVEDAAEDEFVGKHRRRFAPLTAHSGASTGTMPTPSRRADALAQYSTIQSLKTSAQARRIAGSGMRGTHKANVGLSTSAETPSAFINCTRRTGSLPACTSSLTRCSSPTALTSSSILAASPGRPK